jgi:hypothetical protein
VSGWTSTIGIVDDWLIKQVVLIGIPFQNWMVVTFVLILIAALINIAVKRWPKS